jgi:hypothetical protein
MWGAIALSLAVFLVLVALGWDVGAAPIAAGLLLLGCVAVCIWAAAQGRRAEREVDRAFGQISDARHVHGRRDRRAGTGSLAAREAPRPR